MNSRNVLMVTSSFPFGHGESFVDGELRGISGYFDSIELAPCWHASDIREGYQTENLNLDYTKKRWGSLRVYHVAYSFLKALWTYQWFPELVGIFRRGHKLENMKELGRTLYRAKLFEDFLHDQFECKKKEFGLIYFYWMVPEIMGAIAFRKKYRPDLKIVSRAHGGDLYEDRKDGGYAGLRNEVVAGLDEIYCISAHGKSYLEGRYPGLANKFHLARLGVDDPDYLNALPRTDQLSIVSCSFVVEGKRLHLIVAAIKLLLDMNPELEIKWTHIGDGKLFDQLRHCTLSTLTERAEIVFTGYLTQPELMSLYRSESFDVIVNVSDCEGIPVSLMEASSVGIPMIATNVGGSGEIVNSENGVLISDHADIPTIAAALMRFKDRNFGQARRINARSYWQKEFDAKTNYRTFGSQLIGLLDGPARRAI
ncbi:MAG: glycosyltransferase [Pseudomonadota bacterium]